jgi:hypothetical protein
MTTRPTLAELLLRLSGRKMTVAAILVFVVSIAAAAVSAIWFTDTIVAPLFLNSRIERLAEKNLPSIVIEIGRTVYCRMKADDFRFPLPPRAHALNPVVTGGFDTVHGSVEVRFDRLEEISASQYEVWLEGKVPVGGEVKARQLSGGLLIEFSYFGDR